MSDVDEVLKAMEITSSSSESLPAPASPATSATASIVPASPAMSATTSIVPASPAMSVTVNNVPVQQTHPQSLVASYDDIEVDEYGMPLIFSKLAMPLQRQQVPARVLESSSEYI